MNQNQNTNFLSTLFAKVLDRRRLKDGSSSLSPVVDSAIISYVKQTPKLYPYKPLPNAIKFKVKFLSAWHPIFEAFDIFKRHFSPTLEGEKYNNGSLNKYVRTQFTRLNNLRTKPAKFWKLANLLMEKSIAYRVVGFNAVFGGWHRKYSYGKVWQTIEKVRKLDLTSPYKYKIINIPKSSTETRHLGIPSFPWRVKQNMWNNILMVWLSPYISNNQHGYFPERGACTAWYQIYESILSSKEIFEYDINKFFDSINLDYLRTELTIIRNSYTRSRFIHWMKPNCPSIRRKTSNLIKPIRWSSNLQISQNWNLRMPRWN